ncbi:MAG: TVP38/TMEM64 family protein [Spirochaetales bacterium]|nr:MAG: TVP38/TMEM64 family protein [Spirochaetales bacterium]
MKKPSSPGRIFYAAAFPALIICLGVLVFVFREPLWNVFSSPERIREWVTGFGGKAPLVFMALQWLQVVIFIIPGEVTQVAGGYLFGFTRGLLLSLAGIAAGSAFNFWAGRLLGFPFLKAVISEQRLSVYRNFVSTSKAKTAFYLLFVIPGIPKDALSYAAGMWDLKFLPFILLSSVCRIPGILGSVLIGDAVAGKKWFLAVSLGAAAVVLAVLGFIFKEQIRTVLLRIAKKKKN